MRSNVDFGRGVISDVGLRAQNQTTSGQSTTKLFEAIYDENLGDFERTLEEGANVNTFNEEGMTLLMSIANIYNVSNNQTALKDMAKLLIQKRSININVQSEQPVYEKRQKKDDQGNVIFEHYGREMVKQSGNYYIYCNDESLVKDDEVSPILFTTD
ncbi:hypothetical protein [Wolbachia endosymbiont of Trichogramma kaykai]|uniref:hypothetical protein n=1 Tax=Wolbachia endosymbiont of Trichogramma kaykai TaxID=444066 RepID=UPI0038928346